MDARSGDLAGTDWHRVLQPEFAQPYWHELQDFVDQERAVHAVYPAPTEVLAALRLTALGDTRVVILGQDPYHGPGQAHGLSFSVRHGVAIPPSLRNVYKELADDVGVATPEHGNLEAWAGEGVLLLNTSLTVRAHDAGSHRGKGWERFTDSVIQAVSAKSDPVVFILWGNNARAKVALIAPRHHIVESAHPSPLSASRGFFGSKPFSRTNAALADAGQPAIKWAIS